MPFFSKLTKKDSDKAVEVSADGNIRAQEDSSVSEARNWYSDRYESLLVQRNILFIISIVAIFASLFSAFVVMKVSLSKTVIPMLVEVEDKTGYTNIVNPRDRDIWTSDKALNEYFLLKYLNSRETYNSMTYYYNYYTIVRLLSANAVYRQFIQSIAGQASPITRYGSNMNTTLKIRSIQYLPIESGDQTVQIRFTIFENTGGKYYNRIVNIAYNFVQMQLTFDERMVNPLGFQIKSYSVADDVDVTS